MHKNTICTEYKDYWMPRKKVYFQKTKEKASSYFISDGSVSTDQLLDAGDCSFLLLFYNYEKRIA